MVLINGRKYTCDACRRGHRASSCAHTGRQLQLVRPKGRPSSQCNTCKAKRANGNFHGKCHCNSSSSGSRSSSASSAEEDTFTQAATNSKGSRHSLEALMNPCQCKSTGICTCCKSNAIQNDRSSQDVSEGGAGCCDGQECCTDDAPRLTCTPAPQNSKAKSCCSSKRGKESLAPIAPFQAQPDMTIDEVEAMISPPCQCGDKCTCPGCLRKNLSSPQQSEASEDCPEKCLTCSACIYGLTRPSGIDIVDEWMEKDKATKRQDGGEMNTSEGSSKRLKVDTGNDSIAPPLPPFANASSFFSSHFLDPERRRHFAEQMQGDHQPVSFLDDKQRLNAEQPFGQQLHGETDEDWQIRHGFYYLTPDAVRIFDSTRKFKDERRELEERQERLERSATPSESVASSGPSVMSQELNDLRRRALSARKKPSSILAT